jgi:hypothetical protein
MYVPVLTNPCAYRALSLVDQSLHGQIRVQVAFNEGMTVNGTYRGSADASLKSGARL